MANTASSWVSALATTVIVTGWTSAAGGSAPRVDRAQAEQAYAWADSCKTCHKEIYEAWAKTKHARALERLSSSEQEKECVGCHVTGAKTKIEKGNKVVNAGIQCEQCHGAAAAHVADPKVVTGLVRKAPESLCRDCHNERSPFFKGFFYGPMTSFLHPVPK
jgi:hypothetical protein